MEMTDLDFAEMVESVFSGMLGFELVRTHTDGEPEPGDRFIGTVHISGSWQGSVVVECPEKFGRLVAAAMFGNEPDAVEDDEIVDVVGELANMTGGNVKALLEGEATLSLPTVVRGADFRVIVPGTHLTRSLAYECSGHVFQVRVLSKNPS
jgi:CheY-specific phosphatase CheX